MKILDPVGPTTTCQAQRIAELERKLSSERSRASALEKELDRVRYKCEIAEALLNALKDAP